jgi:serine/threonine protein kinase
MPPATASSPADTASRVWAAVADHLERFAAAWEAGEPAELAGFAPIGPPAVRRFTLIELIKFDLEQRLTRGTGRALEEYLREHTELTAGGAPCDLLYEDYHLRLRCGEAVDPADYYRRFPAAADELARLLGDTPVKSTSVFAAGALVSLNAGDMLDDFDLLTLLGEGQFARVFLARQRSMQRLVALKVSGTRAAEAQTLAQLDHPHIVHVFDQRTLTEPPVQLVYMTYVAGGTLQNVLDHVRDIPIEKRSGKTLLDAVDKALVTRGEVRPASSPVRAEWAARTWPAAVCALGAKLASALDYAHQHDVLHRDIKPANVLLSSDAEPMLADFNLGCCTKVDGAGPAAFFGGSLPYMAPEHLEAFNPAHPRSPESLDGRADVYGLAVTLWELWTGERPFGAEVLADTWPATLDALVARRRTGPPDTATSERDVPGLKAVLRRCLDPDPSRRPASASELARELELCLKPATRALVRPKPTWWREFIKRYPLLTAVPVGLAPNALAAWFNIEYNGAEIVRHWEHAEPTFNRILLPINAIFFPLGTLLIVLGFWPTAWRPDRVEAPERRTWRRLRALQLGTVVAATGVGCWLVAGIVWPVTLRMLVGPPTQGTEAYLHFLASLAICGLMAAAYPYFLVTFLAVRFVYPAHIGPEGLSPADRPALRRVGRSLVYYWILVAAVPLAATGLLFWRLAESGNDVMSATQKLALPVLVVAGLLGIGLAWLLDGRIRSDLAALEDLAAV